MSLQYSQIGWRKNADFKGVVQFTVDCRALYQYVEQRYSDVYEEKEIKNIVTNMVMVTMKHFYFRTSIVPIVTENNSGHHQLCGDVSEPRELGQEVFPGDCSSVHAGQFFSLHDGKYQVSRERQC